MTPDTFTSGTPAVTVRRYPGAVPAVPAVLVLAHGAGAGQDSPFMVNAAHRLAAHGLDIVTFNFPYMERKSRIPNPAAQLEACYRGVIATLSERGALAGRALFIGGKSMGGRMATHLAAQHHPDVAGVVVLGYPLHPPGAPDKLRVTHLPDITVPVLIIQGERDVFGTPAALEPHVKTMHAPVTLHPVPGADHSLTVRSKRGADVFEDILTTVADWMKSRRGRRRPR
jgi:predicted alpha/beta-hydrolase family hydrolase